MPEKKLKLRGRQVFIGSCIFSALTIGLVLYDEHRQRERRQVNVKYRLNAIKQKENMQEYELQKQRAEVMHRAGVASLVTKRRRLSSISSLLKPPELQKTNWKRDVVYLFQFKRSPSIPNMSPFCLKLETFLRANDIKYEPIGSWTHRSKEGRLPFVELNGKQIADSQIILWHLQKHFNIDEGLNDEQKGIARAVDRMLEGTSYYPITYFRSVEGAKNTVNPNVSGMWIPKLLIPYFAKKVSDNAVKRLNAEGTGRHSRDVIVEILRRDVEAVDRILDNKKFLLGVRPTTPDFTVFGHLGIGYYLPFRMPIQDILDEEFPRVRQLLERIRLPLLAGLAEEGVRPFEGLVFVW
ncbi:Failed axon connections-like protein [Aphelenchoides fujianensis]|nr:Failed axon connections-like protein [Aphelenchoides fujianensis]